MLHSIDMPSFLAEDPDRTVFNASSGAPYSIHSKHLTDKSIPYSTSPTDITSNGGATELNGILPNGVHHTTALLPDGWPTGHAPNEGKVLPRLESADTGTNGRIHGIEDGVTSSDNQVNGTQEQLVDDDGYFAEPVSAVATDHCLSTHVKLKAPMGVDGAHESKPIAPQPTILNMADGIVPSRDTIPSQASQRTEDRSLRVPVSAHRASSPPAFQQTPSQIAAASSVTSINPPQPGRLQHRHTLEVPRVSTTSRASRDFPNGSEDVVSTTGRFSPNTPTRRRGSMTLARRTTRSINSDMHLDEVPQDDDAARWAEHIRQKRASKRKRRDDEDDDRVVVGTKVDQNHVNWVTAYNMLTGIRFTVSRTNAKMDRELTDADFEARHKFSFDITGNELTPSAKYDFKFKDYAPWVFRHLRAIFKIDPADYLMSLTSKYILSELGSPGKSGSFFYFSRDYKYIIKTIHHAEHKFLRRILKDYYNHVQANPNTLLSQFYGLHRVKIPYGRKIHFVVMNNLFPPHRDIHMTFDLKGSTIGRDFREEDLQKNPRATLKDLNWLRRNMHLEFGPTKKRAFIEQVERDVKLLQQLKIMDYSLLIGIHDLMRGNEENLRENTLQIFEPGGDAADDPHQANMLLRTPSKLEHARKAKELRQMVKSQKPIPLGQTSSKMPDEVGGERKDFYFYSDDGGFRATHEDDSPGEVIYYLGIIDCLTYYSIVKRSEHFIKGMTNPESQISAIPPERYGERFVRFITGITKSRERVLMEKAQERDGTSADELRLSNLVLDRSPTDIVMEKAERQAERSRRHGANESEVPDRALKAVRSPSAERGEMGHTLPVVDEAVESGSTGGRSGRSQNASPQPPLQSQNPPPTPPKDAWEWREKRPPTPPKDGVVVGQMVPPTPPKDGVEVPGSRGRDKALPPPPTLLEATTAGLRLS